MSIETKFIIKLIHCYIVSLSSRNSTNNNNLVFII